MGTRVHRLSRLGHVRPLVAAAAAIALTGLAAACGGSTVTTRTTTVVRSASLVPSCPHAGYGADGNMGPLFCVVINPVAWRYFAPMAKRTFALGPNATPSQVTAALVSDYRRAGTLPILCSIYQLAEWRNGWSFGISAAEQAGAELHFPSGWCSEPSFNGSGL